MGIRHKTRLSKPRKTPLGTFGGIDYVQYDGIFKGHTSTGEFRVPYRITAPVNPTLGNQTVLVEPPHFAIGLGARERFLGQDFLFSRGFSHAGVGWSTTSFGEGADLRILDPNVPGVFINGGFIDENGRTDDEIISSFARALTTDRNARKMLGHVERRYITGFSDSSDPVLRLITSGGANVFDFATPFTAEGHDPQSALAEGLYEGKLIIVNSEAEDSVSFIDTGIFPNQYRFYAVAGTPHIPDFLEIPFFTSMSTPASFIPALRAHFLQGHEWVIVGTAPPLSTHILTTDDGTIIRDANGNAITVNSNGDPVPRLPFVELGEARYITGFIGSYEDVKTIEDLGFVNHGEYVLAFTSRLSDYFNAGYILERDAEEMLRRATLCPPLTFTETYRDHYDQFVAMIPCS